MRVTISLEPWASIAEDGEKLGAAHFEEVDGGVEPRRRFKLDLDQMTAAARAGALICSSARRDAVLVGYLTWTIQRDPEAVDLLWADQGAWFVDSGPGLRSVALGLWQRSLAELRLRKVQIITAHHRMQGRGQGLGRFFERQGAVHVKSIYQLWIGEADNAKR